MVRGLVMETLIRYAAASQAVVSGDRTALYLAPDLNRPPINLQARIKEVLPFRDAMLALRDCIVSELYVSAQEIQDRANDPVITVATDRVFFEAFSRDESTYGRLSLTPAALTDVVAWQPGCTNIDFSDSLRQGLQQMRSSRPAYLEVQRQGLTIAVSDRTIQEQRITLPDAWVQGFLEVQSALRLPAVTLTVHPQDLRNLLTYLKQRKATSSPRSLRVRLIPGEPPEVTVEPWNQVFRWGRSHHAATQATEIKLWGRRRLFVLDKILPHIKQVRVWLQGTGLPSFWLADLGNLSLLIGLSPWTARDWTATEQYHLFQSAAPLSDQQRQQLLALLHDQPAATRSELTLALGWTDAQAIAGLNDLCLQGRVLFAPETERYYARDLFPEVPPPPRSVSKREQDAARLLRQGQITIHAPDDPPVDHLERAMPQAEAHGQRVYGTVQGKGGASQVMAAIATDGSLSGGRCDCQFFARFSLQRGPCKHLIALRLQWLAVSQLPLNPV